MRILLSVEHPAWAHQFRYVIRKLEQKGHTVKVAAINKDRDLELLDAFNIKYDVISNSSGKGTLQKGIIFLKTIFAIWRISREFKPDIYIGRASPMMAINSFLFRKKHILFEDTEHANFSLNVCKLFSTVIITPKSFSTDLGNKQIRVNAFKELFYLHPNYFSPRQDVLSNLGINPKVRYVILRFVAWDAHHDVGQHGLDLTAKRKLIEELGKYARVLITSEKPLPEEFEKYQITAPAERIHDLMYYASLYVGDSQTMTTEAAMLGTPAVRCNTFVGPNDMSNFRELENRYGLIYSFSDFNKALQKAVELIQQPEIKRNWQDKRQKLLEQQIDITQFMVDFIENYPQSFNKHKTVNQQAK